jgi:hypothetical protein
MTAWEGSGPVGRTRAWVAIALVSATLLAACGTSGSEGDSGSTGGTGASGATSTPSLGDRPASTAKLSIVSPKNGEVIHGTSVDLRVKLEDAKIVPATTTKIVPDEGHLHVILDDQLISMTEGTEQTISDLTPGLHRVQVEFVASDHAPFDPRVVAIVSFEVKP